MAEFLAAAEAQGKVIHGAETAETAGAEVVRATGVRGTAETVAYLFSGKN
jgi:hypothetical protein